jgi:hypothetical protein
VVVDINGIGFFLATPQFDPGIILVSRETNSPLSPADRKKGGMGNLIYSRIGTIKTIGKLNFYST